MELIKNGTITVAKTKNIYNDMAYDLHDQFLLNLHSKCNDILKCHGFGLKIKGYGVLTSGRDLKGHMQDYTYEIIIMENGDIYGRNVESFRKQTELKIVRYPSGSKYHGINDSDNIGYDSCKETDYITNIVSCDEKVFIDGHFIPEANGVKYSKSVTNNNYTYGIAFMDRDNVLFMLPYYQSKLLKIVTEVPLTKGEFFALDINGEDFNEKNFPFEDNSDEKSQSDCDDSCWDDNETLYDILSSGDNIINEYKLQCIFIELEEEEEFQKIKI